MSKQLSYQELKQLYGNKIIPKYCKGCSMSQMKTIAAYTFGDLYERLYYDDKEEGFIVVVNREMDEIINGKKTGQVIVLDDDNVIYFEYFWKPAKVIIIKREK